ncbi:uncharacterized protein RCO7_11518 [Rhynchosporium graminicola]|uniref:HNH nuclease domain-containing protein n=1 Tax=Rhynchosporium graminicola TaxID=2792576 RepID=A0A1E1K406_9HELO|nr:uncharacterized protein RCO7_11518 [Rhynchosporium commune]
MAAPEFVASASPSRLRTEDVPENDIPIQSALPRPVPETFQRRPNRNIDIHHPHYPRGSNLLLRLFAPDSPHGGLHYGYLLAVCGIITGNRWDGWLVRSGSESGGAGSGGGREEGGGGEGAGGRRTHIPHHELLPAGKYDFYLDHSTFEEPYPVCLSFRQWQFPHSNLPPGDWRSCSTPPSDLPGGRQLSASNLSTTLTLRDASCRMSGSAEGTQIAHIIPRTESDWHQRNSMYTYHVLSSRSLDEDLSNLLLLRADLHINFDRTKFVFLPKSGLGGDPQVIVHLVEQSIEYEYLYHNRAVLELKDIAPEFLFARLAWTIFPFLEAFLESGGRRRVIILRTDLIPETKWMDRDTILEIGPASQRVRGGKKRARVAYIDAGENVSIEQLENQEQEYQNTPRRKRRRRASLSNPDKYDKFSSTIHPKRARHYYKPTTPLSSPPPLSFDSLVPTANSMFPEARSQSQSQSQLQAQSQSTQLRRTPSDAHVHDQNQPISPQELLLSPSQTHPTAPSRRSSHADSPLDTLRLPTLQNSSSPTSSPVNLCHPPSHDALDTLKATWLDKERQRSDIQHTWQEEKEWAKEITEEGQVMNQEEAARLLAHYGAEFKED